MSKGVERMTKISDKDFERIKNTVQNRSALVGGLIETIEALNHENEQLKAALKHCHIHIQKTTCKELYDREYKKYEELIKEPD